MSEDQNTVALLELLASRMCHDLISPVGAIRNGLEFLDDMGVDALDDARELMDHSATQATARLQAFRMAYGAGGRDPNLGLKDVHRVFAELVEQEGKIKQNWSPSIGETLDGTPSGWSKIVIGSLLLAVECLPKGGEIVVSAPSSNSLVVTLNADPILVRENTREALSCQTAITELDPRLVHPYVLGLTARAADVKAELADTPASGAAFITLSF